MGLDMYAYATIHDRGVFIKPDTLAAYQFYEEQNEIWYWRKFNWLHQWMWNLAQKKHFDGGRWAFNCVAMKLDKDDLDHLEQAALDDRKSMTNDELENILRFTAKARMRWNHGYYIYYEAWW